MWVRRYFVFFFLPLIDHIKIGRRKALLCSSGRQNIPLTETSLVASEVLHNPTGVPAFFPDCPYRLKEMSFQSVRSWRPDLLRQLHPVEGIGNLSCVNAVLVALFGHSECWDDLLHHVDSIPLHAHIRTFMDSLRAGTEVPLSTLDQMKQMRREMPDSSTGTRRNSPLVFLCRLLDTLDVPLISMTHFNLRGNIYDIVPRVNHYEERFLWLKDASVSKKDLSVMLEDYMNGDQFNGFRKINVDRCMERIVKRRENYLNACDDSSMYADRTWTNYYTYGMVVMATNRINEFGARENTTRIKIPIYIPSNDRKNLIPNDRGVSLILRSVICVAGNYSSPDHYITYTYCQTGIWRQWDDRLSGLVPTVNHNEVTGSPRNIYWADDIEANCYIIVYDIGSRRVS